MAESIRENEETKEAAAEKTGDEADFDETAEPVGQMVRRIMAGVPEEEF